MNGLVATLAALCGAAIVAVILFPHLEREEEPVVTAAACESEKRESEALLESARVCSQIQGCVVTLDGVNEYAIASLRLKECRGE